MEQITITAKIQISATLMIKFYLIKPCLYIVMPAIMFQIMYSRHIT